MLALRYGFTACLAVCLIAGPAVSDVFLPEIQGENWLPERKSIEVLESKISLPKGAKPLPLYARFYTGGSEGGRKVIYGMLVLPDECGRDGLSPSLNLVRRQQMPTIYDGGCEIVNLVYDVEAQQIEMIGCNGEA